MQRFRYPAAQTEALNATRKTFTIRTTIITFLTLVAFASSAAVAGMLEIGTVQLRATAPGMGMTGGYVAITNSGESEERLVAVLSLIHISEPTRLR